MSRHLRQIFLFALVFLFIFALTRCGNRSDNTTGRQSPYPRVEPNGAIRGETNFAVLINNYSSGQANPAPWAGYWWSYQTNGTSAAERKFESASGQSGAYSWEMQHHSATSLGVQPWWGHCNGWTAASVLFREPTKPRTVNGVEFSVGDQKALLSEVAMEVNADFFGRRNDDDDPSDPTFQDVFPDQFFLVLTNFLGNGIPVIMDRYTGSQVWNQSLAGYKIAPVVPFDVLPSDPSAPDVTRVNLTTTVWWARDDVQPDSVSVPFDFADSASYQSRTYQFELWLDAPIQFDSEGKIASSGNVVLNRNGQTVEGGVWKYGIDTTAPNPLESHPDYLWIVHSLAPSSGFANPALDQGWVTRFFGN